RACAQEGGAGEARAGQEGRREEGRAQEGRSEEGRAQEGRSEEGRREEGRAQEGRAQEGRAQEGCSQEGRREEGCAQEGGEEALIHAPAGVVASVAISRLTRRSGCAYAGPHARRAIRARAPAAFLLLGVDVVREDGHRRTSSLRFLIGFAFR